MFNKIKRQSKLIIGFVIGIILMGGISYGIDNISSSSVSYTKDGKVMSVKQALNDVINTSLSEINTLKSEKSQLQSQLNTIYQNGVKLNLADVAKVGDYVAYDAGTWTSSADRPTNQGQFGGYTTGTNKANSVSWCYQSSHTSTLKGWRVLSIDKNTKTVKLVHAGQSECYYHVYGKSAESVINLNSRANSIYLNSTYASNVHILNYDELNESGFINTLMVTGDWYFLATAWDNINMRVVGYDGVIGYTSGISYGVRPVVVLKANILTTGKGTDMVGQEAWTLVKP